MITFMIDDMYCDKCKKWHKPLYWHDKYNDYLMPSDCYERYKKLFARFGVLKSEKECREAYQERLDWMQINFLEHTGRCVMCSAETNFVVKNTGKFVCSEECKAIIKER